MRVDRIFGGMRLPYCWKCGTQLEEDTKFCEKCRAPTPLATIREIRKAKQERGEEDWWEEWSKWCKECCE